MSSLINNIKQANNKDYIKRSINAIEMRTDSNFTNDIFNINHFRGVMGKLCLDEILGINIMKPIDFNTLFFEEGTLVIVISGSSVPNGLCIRFEHLQQKYGIKKVKFITKDNGIGFRKLYLLPDCENGNSNVDKYGIMGSIENYEFEVEGKCIRNYIFQNFKVLNNISITNLNKFGGGIGVDDNGIKYPVFTSEYPELCYEEIKNNSKLTSSAIHPINIKNIKNLNIPIEVNNELISSYLTKNGIQINDIKGNGYLGWSLEYDYYEPIEYDKFGLMIKHIKHSEHLELVTKKVNFCKPEILPKHIKFNLKGTNIIINGK